MSTKKQNKQIFKPVSLLDFMPKGIDALQVLAQRSERLAKHVENNVAIDEQVNYIRFRLGKNEFYGIPYHYTKEVMNNIVPNKLPNVPKYIAGIINRRGALLAIVDLKYFFHTEKNTEDKNPYLIIISANGMTVGMLADSIEGSDYYNPASLDPPLTSDGVTKPEYVLGLHKGTTTIINVEAMMLDPQLQVQK